MKTSRHKAIGMAIYECPARAADSSVADTGLNLVYRLGFYGIRCIGVVSSSGRVT